MALKFEWDPGLYAVHFHRADPDDARGTRIVRHDAAPFIASVVDSDELTEDSFREIGYTYLKTLEDFLVNRDYSGLKLPLGWMSALDPKADNDRKPPLRWLDVWPPFGERRDDESPPRLASWQLIRRVIPKEGASCKTLT